MEERTTGVLIIGHRYVAGSPIDAYGVVVLAAQKTDPSPSSLHPDALKSGARLGRYLLGDELGRGGSGLVFRAHDTLLDVPVCIKVLHPRLATNPEALARFKREILLARRIAHPGVCKLFELHEESGVRFITMELVAGTMLRDTLAAARPFPVDRTITIARSICRALGAAHDVGVIHRDLKPRNVMIGLDDEATLLDFGVATSSAAKSALTAPGIALGTQHYIAPEVWAGQPASSLSDLYALGVILYTSLVDRMPFATDTAIALLNAMRTALPTRPNTLRNDVPRALDDIVLRLLSVDPRKRFQSARDVEAALCAVHPATTKGATLMQWGPRDRPLTLSGRTAALDAADDSNVDETTMHDDGGGRTSSENVVLEPAAPSKAAAAAPVDAPDVLPEMRVRVAVVEQPPRAPTMMRPPPPRVSWLVLAASVTLFALCCVGVWTVVRAWRAQNTPVTTSSAPTLDHKSGEPAEAFPPGEDRDAVAASTVKRVDDEGGAAALRAARKPLAPPAAPAPLDVRGKRPPTASDGDRARFIEAREEIESAARAKGLVSGDVPELDAVRRNLAAALADEHYTPGIDEARRGLAVVDDVVVDRRFVSAKLTRLNDRFDRLTSANDRARIEAVTARILDAFSRDRFIEANGALNQAFAMLRDAR